MKCRRFLVGLCSLAVGIPLFCKAQDRHEELSAAFTEARSGVVFPLEIGKLNLRGKTDFGTPVTSSSLRYDSSDGTKVDVYLYTAEHDAFPQEKDELIKIAASVVGEAGSAILEIERRGTYRDVEIPDEASVSDFGGADEPLFMVSQLATYRQVPTDGADPAEDRGRVESLIAATVFRDRIFKVRYTFRQLDDEADEERREQRRAFVKELRGLFLDVQWRDKLPKSLTEFFADPLSDAGKSAGDFIFAYAEISKVAQIVLSSDWVPFLVDYDVGESPVGRALLFGYLAGNIEKQISSGDFSYQSRAGVEGFLRVYRTLRASGAAQANTKLDDLIARQDAGTLDDWLDEAEAKTEQEKAKDDFQ